MTTIYLLMISSSQNETDLTLGIWFVYVPKMHLGEGTIHGRTFELKLSSSSTLKLLSVNTHPI